MIVLPGPRGGTGQCPVLLPGLNGPLVLDLEPSRHSFGLHARHGFVGLAVNDTHQRDPAVLHDDRNGIDADGLDATTPRVASDRGRLGRTTTGSVLWTSTGSAD